MPTLFSFPKTRAFDTSGDPLPSASLYFFETASSTPLDTYSDPEGNTPNSNPVTSDAYGVWGPIWLQDNELYRVQLRDEAGVVQWTVDGVGLSIDGDRLGLALWPLSTAEQAAGFTDADLTPQFTYGDVRRYGATTGAADNSAAFEAAYAQAVQSGGSDVYAEGGTYLFTSSVTLPNANTRIYGNATLRAGGALANGILYQANRGVCTTIDGLTCTGKSPLFRRYASDSPLPWTTQYLEFRIRNVSFKQDSDTYAAYLYGAREGSFTDCYFETCKGVYADYSINVDFIGCHAKNAVNIAELASGVEGVKFIGGTALGCTYCVKATGILGLQIIGVMWDYNDNPVSLTACQQVIISGSYITSRSTTAPVINIVPDGATRSEDIYISNNPQLANVASSGTGRIINAEDADYVTIAGNQLKLWRDVGVYLDNCTQVNVEANKMIAYPTAGTYSVQTATADATVRLERNNVTNPFSLLTTRDIRFNSGYVSEASGEATLSSGQTSKTVAHGLAMAPLKAQVKITPTSPLVSATYYFIAAVDATNITVTASGAVGSDFSFSWEARIAP